VQQDDLFEQYTTLLQALARQIPLLLVVDDLQWADLGSISLLFHLGRRLEGSAILAVGAYRLEEVALGRDGERHPLEAVVNELKRSWGDIEVDLGQSEGRHFVPALLDSERNRLDAGFRHMLYQQTQGHPLFTVELLRGMQERGDLIQDPEGYWVEGPKLNWGILPARVEAVIAERIERLAEPLKEIARAASVEGEVFTAEVVARTQAVEEREIVASLSGELDRKHRLVSAQGIERVASQRLSRYRFRHILFQKYLYNSLDQVERAHLHEQVGSALETLHGARTDERAAIAPQLAWHFEQAGMPARAVEFFQQAGDRAVHMSANREAIVHLRKGLDLVQLLPDTPERARRELALLLAIVVPTIATQSWAAPELGQVYARTRELGQEMGHTPRTLQAMILERAFYTAQGAHRTGLALAEQFHELARRLEDPLYVMLSYVYLGVSLMFMGHLRRSLEQFEQGLTLYEPQLHRSLAFVYGEDPGVVALSFATYDLWYLGYPDQALEKGQEAVALATELDHPMSMVFAVAFAARVHRRRREIQVVEQYSEKQAMLWAEHGIPLAEAESLMNGGWVLSRKGQHQEGIAQFNRGLAIWQSTGMALHHSEFLALLAEMYREAGQPEEAASALDKARKIMCQNEERYHEAELCRLEGELLLAQGLDSAPQAEALFCQAIDIARQRGYKVYELRATVSLCRLWLAQGGAEKRQEAHQMLSAVYGWFTEGSDTPDLEEAKALLEALA
jgi:predicted ATPase